jgi:hypothetical protein
MFTTIKDYLIGSTIKAVIFTLAMVSITVGISVPVTPASTIGTPTPDLSESDIQGLIKEAESRTTPPEKPKGAFFNPKPLVENNTIYDGFRVDDIVDLIYNQNNKLVSKERIANLVRIVIDEAPNYGNPPIHVILAIINRESTWDSKAKSGSSYGAMQVHYRVWGDYCNLESAKSLYNPRIGVRCGLKVFTHYLEANNGNVNKTLQRYRGSDSRTNIRYARDVLRTANKIKTVLSS